MKKIIIPILTILIIFIFSFPIYASSFDPTTYNPPTINPSDVEPVMNIAKTIANTIAVIGAVVSVITIIVIGLKYITGSIQEKAEYKKSMIPYLIGAVMTFGITQFLRILVNMVNNVN